ncbi:hypothetical protein QE399_002636 [Paracidovorax wautersii]|uniref:Uncharacterized protein n=1 Tax=Paracidovorax wautersii TaxID=1177982 RepID=A0ABU1ICM9_9BURK|nr:hypothetical protein [Paracidovorax wautersii]
MSALPANTLKWFSQNQVIFSCNCAGEYTARSTKRRSASRCRVRRSRWYASCAALRASSFGSFFRACWRACRSMARVSIGVRVMAMASIWAWASGGKGACGAGRSRAATVAEGPMRCSLSSDAALAPQVSRSSRRTPSAGERGASRRLSAASAPGGAASVSPAAPHRPTAAVVSHWRRPSTPAPARPTGPAAAAAAVRTAAFTENSMVLEEECLLGRMVRRSVLRRKGRARVLPGLHRCIAL